MATKKERRASALTIAAHAPDEKSPNYGHFRPAGSGNSPASLPAGLPARLPYGLPELAEPTDAPSSPVTQGVGRQARIGGTRKLPRFPRFAGTRGLRPPRRGPGQPGALLREPGPIVRALEPDFGPLGIPLNISEVARLIGCSPWTVRQTLIPRGLPHFRFKASGRLTFYQGQVIRWIEYQQQGGKKTK